MRTLTEYIKDLLEAMPTEIGEAEIEVGIDFEYAEGKLVLIVEHESSNRIRFKVHR